MPIAVPETVYDSVLFKGCYGTLKLTEEQISHHTVDKVSVVPWKKVARRQVASASSKSAKPMFKLILKSGTEAVFTMEDRVSLEVLRDDLSERIKTWRRMHPEEESVAVNKTNFLGKRESAPYRMVNTDAQQRRSSYMGPSVEKPKESRRASTNFRPSYMGTHQQEQRRSSMADRSTQSEQVRRTSMTDRSSRSSRTSKSEPQQQQQRRNSSYLPQQHKPRHSRRSSYNTLGSTPQPIYVKTQNLKKPERKASPSPPPYCRTFSAETVKHTNNRRSSSHRYQ